MLNVKIHYLGSGLCSLTTKEGEGLCVTFEDGTIRESFLSWKAFRQILSLKMGQGKPDLKALALPTRPTPPDAGK